MGAFTCAHSHTRYSSFAITSLKVFSIFMCVPVARPRLHLQKFPCVPLFNKKVKFVDFHVFLVAYVMFCAIWYRLYNFKNVKNTHGGVSFLVKAKSNFTKSNTLPWVFFTSFKLYKRQQIAQNITYMRGIKSVKKDIFLKVLWFYGTVSKTFLSTLG